jgi:acetyl esterase
LSRGTLDPDLVEIIKQVGDGSETRFDRLTPAEARKVSAKRAATRPPGPALPSVFELEIPGRAGPLRARAYVPSPNPSKLPVLVYFHGGGWVVGGIEQSDAFARALAQRSELLVLSVDYRLAPEHPFPAPLDDCFDAVDWALCHAGTIGGDSSWVAVGGDSSGGNLAAAVTLRMRDAGRTSIACQLLIYPVLDHDFETTSYKENAEGYTITRPELRWFWDQYVPNASDRNLPEASPLRAVDFKGLPPAYIVTAGFDPLCDEGRAYAAHLHESGVPTTLAHYDGLTHGFFGMMHALPAGRAAIDEIALHVRNTVAEARS